MDCDRCWKLWTTHCAVRQCQHQHLACAEEGAALRKRFYRSLILAQKRKQQQR